MIIKLEFKNTPILIKVKSLRFSLIFIFKIKAKYALFKTHFILNYLIKFLEKKKNEISVFIILRKKIQNICDFSRSTNTYK